MIFAALLGLAPPATGQEEVGKILSVSEVRQILEARTRKGEIVRVRGFVSDECRRLSCELLSEKGNSDSEWVSIDGDTKVEKELVARSGKPVVLRVKLGEPRIYETAEGEIVAATDRASEIIPIEIEN